MSAAILIVVAIAILLYYMYYRQQQVAGGESQLTDLGPIPESNGTVTDTDTSPAPSTGSDTSPAPSTGSGPSPPPPPPPMVSGDLNRPVGTYHTNNLSRIAGGTVGVVFLIDEVLTRVMEKKPGTATLITSKVSEQLLKSVEKPLQNLGAKIGGKIGAKLASLGKSAGVAGVKAGAAAARAMAGAALGPAFIAEMAFSMVSGTMDGMNLGGFANFKTMKMLDTMRDSIDEMFKEALGEDYPWVYGPLDDMDGSIFKKKRDERVDAYFDKKMNEILEKIPSSVKTVPQLNAYVDAEVAKINEETVSNEILTDMCTEAKGSMFTKPNGSLACSYTKDKCVSKWPVSGEEKYYEWNDNSCQVRPVHMRKQCEGMGLGVSYDMNTGSCKLTKEYCGRYGGSAVMRGNDCVITEGQDIAEAIFGRTITRSIVNIFDFKNNYEKCPAGMNEATELIALAAIGGIATGPIGGAVSIGATTGMAALGMQFLCSGSVCPPGQEMMMQTKGVNKSLGGLCYKPCDPGYSSNWAPGRESAVAGMCYKDCPSGWRGTTEECVRDADTKQDIGTPPRQTCPSAPNYKFRGLDCEECDRDGRDRWVDGSCRHGRTIYAGKIHPTTKTCSDDKELVTIAGISLCYPKCSSHGDSYRRQMGTAACQRDYDSIKRTTSVRQPTKAAYSVHKKKRLVPFPSTSEEDFKNSPIGKQIQRGINGVRDGNPEEIGKAFAGYVAVANPAVLITNTSEAVDASMTKNNQLT